MFALRNIIEPKNLILFAAMLAFNIPTTSFAAKVGYVSLQKAIQETSDGKKAKAKLEKEFKDKKKELEKKETKLKAQQKELEKEAMVLSDDVRAKKQQAFEQGMLEYRESVGKSQIEIQKKERELTMPIVEGLRNIIDEIAKKEDYTMILDKSEQSVLWADPKLNLTDRVIKEYEKRK